MVLESRIQIEHVLSGTHQDRAEPLLQLLLRRQGQFRSRRLFQAAGAERVLRPFHVSAGRHLHAAWSVPHGSSNQCTLMHTRWEISHRLIHLLKHTHTGVQEHHGVQSRCPTEHNSWTQTLRITKWWIISDLLIPCRSPSFWKHLNLKE